MAADLPTPVPAHSPLKRDRDTRFSGETAKLMAQRSVEARRQKALAAKQAAIIAATPKEPIVETVVKSAFALEQLLVVRARMRDIDAALITELGKDSPEGAKRTPDANKIDRLASAWSKFSEQERILDGRPLPGSRKPQTERRLSCRSNNMTVE